MPDFQAWKKANDGDAFNTTDYLAGVFSTTSLHPDIVVAFTELLWPRFVEVDGAVFHAAHFNTERYVSLLETHPTVREREYWMNLVILDRLFEAPNGEFYPQHATVVLSTAASMWRSRLLEAFPHRTFQVVVVEDAEAGDFGLTFMQAERPTV